MARDFSTISPSARSLLMVKAHTSLPYARHAAELVFGADAVAAAADAPDAARRRAHFEQRARSLDEALDTLGMRRILELASGLSFQGGRGRVFAEHGFRVETKLAPSEDPWGVRETWTMKLR